jgi:hypothetical protein
VLRAFKTAPMHTPVRPTAPLVANRGANSCYPSPASESEGVPCIGPSASLWRCAIYSGPRSWP